MQRVADRKAKLPELPYDDQSLHDLLEAVDNLTDANAPESKPAARKRKATGGA